MSLLPIKIEAQFVEKEVEAGSLHYEGALT